MAGMRLTCLLLASLALYSTFTQAEDEATGTITIYREKADSAFKSFSSQDSWAGSRRHVLMTLDGAPLIDMHAGTFASYSLPTGRHDVGFGSGLGNTSFELHKGEHLYIRPNFTAPNSGYGAQPFTRIVDCKAAVTSASEIKPLDAKYVVRPGRLKEANMPSNCD